MLKDNAKLNRCKKLQRQAHGIKKYDRTSKAKDVLIAAKDKRIAKLEEENRRLQRELDNLRRILYENK